MTVIADTLQAKKRLLEAGFTDEKAEGIIAIFRGADAQIATKLDLELYCKDIKVDMHARFDATDARIGNIGDRIDKLEERLDECDTRFDSIDTQLGKIDARFEKMELQMVNLVLKAQLGGVALTVAILSALGYFM